MKRLFFCSLFLLSFLLISCELKEGEGGTSTISGKVIIKQYNSNFTILTEQYFGPDEDVYIIYGDERIYSDKTKTNYDGAFEFKYLREGEYTVFAYSEDSANYPTRHEIPVFRNIKITKKNQTVYTDDIYLLK